MPKIKDKRLEQGKENRKKEIRLFLEKRFNEGLRYEIVEEEAILKFGISASAIARILKQ